MSDAPVFVSRCPFCGEVHPVGTASDIFDYDEKGQGIPVNPHVVVFVTCLDRHYQYEFKIPLDKFNQRAKLE